MIRIIPPYESRSYVLLTEQILKGSGITIHDEGLEIRIPGNQHYRPSERTVEGDDSQAAFFEALGVISGKPVCIHGINPESMQGDHAMLDILREMGGSLTSLLVFVLDWAETVGALPETLAVYSSAMRMVV